MQLPHYKPDVFGKVAVLMGGESAEREISLQSGKAVYDALLASGVDAHAIDFNRQRLPKLISDGFDRVFIALHGRGGEDGAIQGALESIGLPYTGTGVLGSALAMDKSRSKAIWQNAGLPTPPAVELNSNSDWSATAEELGLPIMVKPVREGSSIGASKVMVADDLFAAWEQASSFDDRVLAERWISGAEYTVPILHGEVLPVIKLETKRDFYDYQAKYVDDDTQYICPCGLDAKQEQLLGELGQQACRALDVSGWARADLMMDSLGQPWLIEVNTVPGMTSHSLVPMAARQAGISFEELVVQILATSFNEDGYKDGQH
ncbi:MAG: D-alanine--D-alanine ligase [Gammaproteobacteria bacterium]